MEHRVGVSPITKKDALNIPQVVGYRAVCSCGRSADLLIADSFRDAKTEVMGRLACQQQSKTFNSESPVGNVQLSQNSRNRGTQWVPSRQPNVFEKYLKNLRNPKPDSK